MSGRSEPILIVVTEDFGSAEGYVAAARAEQLPNFLRRHDIRDEALVAVLREKHEFLVFLDNINVDEASRGKGLGNDLMARFLDETFNQSATAILLLADLHETQAPGFDLQAWYESYGFETMHETAAGRLMILAA